MLHYVRPPVWHQPLTTSGTSLVAFGQMESVVFEAVVLRLSLVVLLLIAISFHGK